MKTSFFFSTLFPLVIAAVVSGCVGSSSNTDDFFGTVSSSGASEGESNTGLFEIGTPALSISAASTSFGALLKNSGSASLTVTIANQSALSVGLGSFSEDSPDFDIASNSCLTSLAPGASCTLSLRFAPTAVGSRSTRLQITYTTSIVQTVPYVIDQLFSGTGTDLTVSVTPNSQSLAVGNFFSLTPSGGTAPYTYSIVAGLGTLSGSTYTAPASTIGTTTATVRVTDAAGRTADCAITIEPPVQISPTTNTILVSSSQVFSASGGVPPYVYDVLSGGGSFTGATYTAPATPAVVIVRVRDSRNNASTATLDVRNPVTISPATKNLMTHSSQILTAQGGVPPYSFTLTSGAGTLTPSATTASFIAPAAAGTSVVQVQDSTGATASATLTTLSVTQIAAGSNSTCALLSNGTIRCWGGNQQGQLGNGSVSIQETTPVEVAGIANATLLGTKSNADGYSYHCAIVGTGAVKCWGMGDQGSLGDGLRRNSPNPVSVSGVTTATQLALGHADAFALLASGQVSAWGQNAYGELGDATTTQRILPILVPGISTAIQISAGFYHACVVLSDNTVRCMGQNNYGQLGDTTTTDRSSPTAVSTLTTAVQVAAGYHHTCARLSSGSVQCWGFNQYGQLGDGTTTNRSAPVPVSGLTDATHVAVGTHFSCAIRATGQVVCWGQGGNLGNNSTGNSATPTAVTGLTSVASITLGSNHGCALRSDNSIWCWGKNLRGETGTGVSYPLFPTEVSGITTAVSHSAAAPGTDADWACAVLQDGTVRCWGYNQYGGLGDGTTVARSTPVTVAGITDAVEVRASNWSACVRRAGGTVSCWGYGLRGDLGNGPGTSSLFPVAVSSLTGVTQLAAGQNFYCALLTDQTVKCWGYNPNGQLGDGTTTNRTTPVAVSGLSGVVQISAGYHQACARLSSGDVKCWGNNTYGQLSDGTNTLRSVPVTMQGISNAISVGMSYPATYALQANGALLSVGSGTVGELGNGTNLNSYTPVSTSLLENATAVFGTGQGGCALTSTDKVFCWGYNIHGTIGTGDFQNRLVPSEIETLRGRSVMEISGSNWLTCARTLDRKIFCWGNGQNGGVGNGSRGLLLTPAQTSF